MRFKATLGQPVYCRTAPTVQPDARVGSLMLPHVLSIVALVRVARKASYPQALMKPYRKGER